MFANYVIAQRVYRSRMFCDLHILTEPFWVFMYQFSHSNCATSPWQALCQGIGPVQPWRPWLSSEHPGFPHCRDCCVSWSLLLWLITVPHVRTRQVACLSSMADNGNTKGFMRAPIIKGDTGAAKRVGRVPLAAVITEGFPEKAASPPTLRATQRSLSQFKFLI